MLGLLAVRRQVALALLFLKRKGRDANHRLEWYGFVKVPKSWVRFHEVEGGNDIQYSDGTDINIVTLNTFKAEQFNISEEEYAKLDVVNVSSSILTSKEQSSDFQ